MCISVCECMLINAGVPEARHIRSPVAGVTDSLSHPEWVLGIKFGLSAKT